MLSSSAVLVAVCLLQPAFSVVTEPLYSVPEPFVEAFQPKGLRVSIPDAKDVRSVQFVLSLSQPVTKGDVGEFNKEVTEKEGSHWIYWNPTATAREGDTLFYRLVVRYRDLYWTKEGRYRITELIPLSDDVDCEEVQEEQSQLPESHGLGVLEDQNLGKVTQQGGRRSAYKSSYSMYKSGDMKPITRSSTTTTTGTFFIKPTGVEGSGYKTSSNYDSTRHEGDQWQHSRSELSAAEVEEMKRLHGDGWSSFSSYSGHTRPSGSYKYEESYYSKNGGGAAAALPLSVHGSDATGGSTSGSGSYQQSYYSQQTRTPGNTFKFQIPIQVAGQQGSLIRTENVDTSHTPSGYIPSGATYEKHEYRKETTSSASSHPESSAFLSGNVQTVDKPVYNPTYEYQRKESTITNDGVQRPLKPAVTYEYQRKETTATNENSVRPVGTSPAYSGAIFTTYYRATTPEDCSVLDIDQRGTGSIRDVEKSVSKLSCLATLSETTLREELRLVKESNAEFRRRFQLLEDKLARLRESCECLQISGS